MKLNDIIHTEEEVLAQGYKITNEIIHGTDLSVIGHFGNAVSINVWTGCCCLLHGHNNTDNIGYIIKALVELFDLTDEDGYVFKNFKEIPCRIISNGWGSKVVGFGHFMKNKFVYTDEFMKITE